MCESNQNEIIAPGGWCAPKDTMWSGWNWLTRDAAIEDLTEAIRLTVEYVGTDTLKAEEGWSWFDALMKYAPEKAAAFLPKPFPTTPGSVVRARLVEYKLVYLCMLNSDGDWVDEDGDCYLPEDIEVLEVLFDAGSLPAKDLGEAATDD